MFGLGDINDNPCTWWDFIYARDACLNWKLINTPNDPVTIMESRGLIQGGAQILGQTGNQAFNQFTSSLLSNPETGQTDWLFIGALGLAGYLLFKKVL